jgi:hypothetical protein
MMDPRRSDMFIRIFAALSIFSAASYAQSCPLTAADAKT